MEQLGRVDGQLAICDDPDLPMQTERFIACTFVVTERQVTHLIQWSKQNNERGDPFYVAQVQPCDRLPDWAIAVIAFDYQQTNHPSSTEPKTYLPSLDQVVDRASLDRVRARIGTAPGSAGLVAESTAFLLPPPADWIVHVQHPALFAAPVVAPDPGVNAQAAGVAGVAGGGGVQHPILHAALQPAPTQGVASTAAADDRAVLDADGAGVAGDGIAQREGDHGAERGGVRTPSLGRRKDE